MNIELKNHIYRYYRTLQSKMTTSHQWRIILVFCTKCYKSVTDFRCTMSPDITSLSSLSTLYRCFGLWPKTNHTMRTINHRLQQPKGKLYPIQIIYE